MNEIYFRANSHGTQPKKLDNFPILKGINARIPFVANSKIIGGSRPSDKGGGAVIQTLRIGGSGLKKMFRPFGPQFRERWGGGGGSPGSATENGGRTKPIAKSYATHGHEPSGSESTVGSE